MMAFDYVLSLTAKIGEYTVAPIKRQFEYVIYYNRNMNALRYQVSNMEQVQSGVQGSVDAAKRNGEVILPKVEQWLTSVDQIAQEYEKFEKDEVRQNRRSFLRRVSCHDLRARYRVGKKAWKKKKAIDELLSECNFDRVANPAPPPTAAVVFAGNAEAFKSRELTFNAIIKALEGEDKVSIIGVYGMGGIGKTTLVQEVAKEAENRKLIDEFAMSVVSQSPNMRKIQSDIAEMLGLQLTEENVLVRAGRLFERLNQPGKRVLLILDDLWNVLDLSAIGIPQGQRQAVGGLKIILTSRDRGVCRKMNSRLLAVNVLSHTDSWNFFRAIAGDEVDSRELHPIAKEIVAKCAGLPIAVKTVALALKGKHIHAWKHARRQFQNSTPKNIQGVSEDVYSALNLSYQFLETNEHRHIFLLCSLFAEDADIQIEDLVRYGTGLGMLLDVDTMEAATERTQVLVDDLKSHSLLLNGKTENSMKMHDVVHDFAQSVASCGEHVSSIRKGAGVITWLNCEACKHHQAISLLSMKFAELPDGLDCSKLQLLLFQPQQQDMGLDIPRNFFEGMKKLEVLDMRHMKNLSMPTSMQSLLMLKTLCLEHCRLIDISLIGELRELRVLSLIGSSLEELPEEIGLLKHLKILDLTNCNQLKVIPADLISRLTRLECLNMQNSFTLWGHRGNATVAELKFLPCMKTLEMHVPDIGSIPSDLLFQDLTRFCISIGSHPDFENANVEKMLTLDQVGSTLPKGVNALIGSAQSLKFIGCSVVKAALDVLNKEGFSNLKRLMIRSNKEDVKYLFDSSKRRPFIFFPVLEILDLCDMRHLKGICHDDILLPEGSFGELRELKLKKMGLTSLWNVDNSTRHSCYDKLRTVEIMYCDKLKHLFPESASRHLGQLRDMCLHSCKSLEEIFMDFRLEAASGVQNSSIRNAEMSEATCSLLFPQLHYLQLQELPELKAFCRGPAQFSSLRYISIKGCAQMTAFSASLVDQDSEHDRDFIRPFFTDKVSLPALVQLDVADLGNVETLWHRQLPPSDSFCLLRVLKVKNCHKFFTVIPSHIHSKLMNLRVLVVEGCESVEVIVETEAVPLLTYQLSELTLSNLPNLRIFCFQDCMLKMPFLEEMDLKDCPNMQMFCKGGPFTPELKFIRVGNGRTQWDGNLNNTIRHLFEMKKRSGTEQVTIQEEDAKSQGENFISMFGTYPNRRSKNYRSPSRRPIFQSYSDSQSHQTTR